ncbi:MAG: glycosyltransferase family 39 protein [Chloroflexi bacterium]|nr:glycosyltransferase family 39 protein [Chloroflexota bacterium]
MEITANDVTITPITRSTVTARVFQYFSLSAILCLALFLHFFRLDQEGFANLYYAATVKSMLMKWHNFFFASFDPGGFVTVDKPPLGLWIQASSATIFGFSGWSLLLPQAIAGVLSVALLYHLVARVFGVWAGVIAALALTVTPISIAANRNNTMDSQLVFVLLLAAWMVMLAIDRGQLRWLLASAILVGIGFNIKMLQAFMVLPAFWLAYLIAARTKWYWRVAHLAVATIVLAFVSFAWVVVVDLTPADQRPFVGSSKDNTEMELIVGHNGLARLGAMASWLGLRNAPMPGQRPQAAQPAIKPQFNPPPGQLAQPPRFQPQPGQPAPNAPAPGGGPTSNETGDPGIFRLFNKQLAGQSSWLLPLALLGMLVLAIELFLARHDSRITHRASSNTFQSWLLWSGWLVPQIIFFSFAGLFHRYYLEMLAPALAALVGAGIAAMWHAYARREWRGIFLPIAILATAAVQAIILLQFAQWNGWLMPVVMGLGALTSSALMILFLLPRHPAIQIAQCAFAVAGVLALLIAPTVWSFTPLMSADSGLPFAGPELATRPSRPANLPNENRLIEYLRANRGGAKFLVATMNANTAAPLILATGEPVMTLGGFGGNDQILTPEQLSARVAQNEVRFFWLASQANQNADLTRWVSEHCARIVQPNQPQPAPNPGSAQTLYDCARPR